MAEWHVEEGSPVGFGQPICDIAIDTFAAMQRTKRATLLGSGRRSRQRRVRDDVSIREGRGVALVTLKCSEPDAALGRVLVEAGERIDIGGVVAVLVTGTPPSAIDDADIAGAAEARVVADFHDGALHETD